MLYVKKLLSHSNVGAIETYNFFLPNHLKCIKSQVSFTDVYLSLPMLTCINFNTDSFPASMIITTYQLRHIFKYGSLQKYSNTQS